MKISRSDIWAILGLLGFLLFFYPDIFLVKTAPLIGDHLEQHYPWAFLLAQYLKEWKLPFWTPLIQCGFPIAAESQIGIFYLPNLLLYLLLPFRTAYSYMNLFHWLIAGWGTYAYAKKMNLSATASFIAAMIFVFGSAYGGAYYNMTSLKTICWFPAALYFFECYLVRPRFWILAGMALVIGQSMVAGYLQMAALTWLMFAFYAVLRILFFSQEPFSSKRKWRLFGIMIFTSAMALFLALPQIFLTFQMAMGSNRTGLEEGYAYVGSMSPMVLGTFVIPNLSLVFRGNNLYAGAFPFFLLLFALFSSEARKISAFRIWGIMTLLALLLALGRWSPLYVGLIKLTHFYSFRVPAKFLVFISFGVAMLSAVGFHAICQKQAVQGAFRKAFSCYLGLTACFLFATAVGHWLLTSGRTMAVKIGEFFVMRYIYAKPGHPHDLEMYLQRVRDYPEQAARYFSFADPANIWMVVITLFCIVFLMVLYRKKIMTRLLVVLSILFLTVDLYALSFLDIRYDLAPYDTMSRQPFVAATLDRERAAGRLGRLYGFRAVGERLPLIPGQDLLYGIADIGVYTPLVSKRYYETIGLLGNVNDSNYQYSPDPDFVLERLPLLGFMNVSHVLSARPLDHPDLVLMDRDPQLGSFLYRYQGSHERTYFMTHAAVAADWEDLRKTLMAPNFDPRTVLLLEKSEEEKLGADWPGPDGEVAASISLVRQQDESAAWELRTDRKGFFVVSDTFYPGWEARVNGKPAPILRAHGLFRAVWIEGPGNHHIEFQYKPFRDFGGA